MSEFTAPITFYLVHHPDCSEAEQLSSSLFSWFRLGDLAGEYAAAGLPVFFRRNIANNGIDPSIHWEDADLNVVILLVDHRAVLDPHWRAAMIQMADQVRVRRDSTRHRALLIPVALHESFYQTGSLYENFNPVRLIQLESDEMLPVLRRSSTEASARALRGLELGTDSPPALNVFLSHAKADGTEIAKSLRDGVRNFGQLVAWYDANDLPYGSNWQSPMEHAAASGTASMVATVTDAYPTRPWCRKEARLARTPLQLKPGLWTVQPVLAVHNPEQKWVREMSMLNGVPRIGWGNGSPHYETEHVVDRLVLEILLTQAHRRIAEAILKQREDGVICITWVPDTWTLIELREQLGSKSKDVRKIVYPGHGLRTVERAELASALNAYGASVELSTFEEVL